MLLEAAESQLKSRTTFSSRIFLFNYIRKCHFSFERGSCQSVKGTPEENLKLSILSHSLKLFEPATIMTTFTAVIQESKSDVDFLMKNKYNLALSKQVYDGSPKAKSNTIFRSSGVAATMTIAWSEVYGINWRATIPTPGARVTFEGFWQACNLGQAYTLNAQGMWDLNSDGKPGWMTAVNHFKDVCIVIGVQDQASAEWQPVSDQNTTMDHVRADCVFSDFLQRQSLTYPRDWELATERDHSVVLWSKPRHWFCHLGHKDQDQGVRHVSDSWPGLLPLV